MELRSIIIASGHMTDGGTGINETLNLSMGTNLEGSIDGRRDVEDDGRLEPTPVIGPSRTEGRRLGIVWGPLDS